MNLRFIELFAGAGGLSLGLERAGWTCAAHAEIAEAPRAILRHRWPDTPLYGDVTTLDGRALVAAHGSIDLLTGGSPCQDLSVAGKRAGLAGARSGLFYEQMRLWDETGADLCLWENVDGARSSNNGRDFGEVLRAFVGAAVPLPSDGWRSAGVAAGPAGVAAWRVLDAQFFGVPQRRRRIFVLGTRTGRIDPAEVLSLAEGVRGDSPARGEAWEGTAAGTDRSVAFALRGRDDGAQLEVSGSVTSALRGTGGGSSRDMVFAFNTKQDGADAEPIAPTLLAMPHDESHANGGGQVGIVEVARCDTAGEGQRNDWETCTLVVAMNNDSRAACTDHAPPLRAGERAAPSVFAGIPRRLTPRECERLMSWPDDHTLVPDAKGKLLSDAARYKAIGNGVASVHSHWIGWRLALALTPTPDPSHD